MNKVCKIAITGGPSGGKTTLIENLRRELGQKCTIVPEAASILYRGGFPRLKSNAGFEHAQRAIYATQKELEDLMIKSYPGTLIICDRGSLDSVAYWPTDSEVSFFQSIGTSEEYELLRYDWVIHLDTAHEDFYDYSNPLRTETYAEAWELNQKIKHVWSHHPRQITIPHNSDFMSKMSSAMAMIRSIFANQNIVQPPTDVVSKEKL